MDADMANVPITTLTTVYGDVMLFITYPSLPTPKALRFDKVAYTLNGVGPSVTVQQWLTAQGNKTLPFEAVTPTLTPRYVAYVHAWHAGYDFVPRPRNGVVGTNMSLWEQEDLIATHPDFTPAYINDYALFQVNGYIHINDFTDAGCRIVDGNRTVRVSNDNQIGLLSFEDVGKITKAPITSAMVVPQRTGAPLKDAVYVTIPTKYNLTNKTVLMVIGGYLHTSGRAFTQIGDRTYKVNLPNLMMLDRYLQAKQHLDLSAMGMTDYTDNPSLTSIAELYSDTAIRAWLTMSQSFFVIVDAPSFFHSVEPVEDAGLPGRYYTYVKTDLPLMGAYGRGLDYHTIQEQGTTVICAATNVRNHYDANRRQWQLSKAVDGGKYPANPFRHTHAFLRYMGTEG
jgi:hypothetical protein